LQTQISQRKTHGGKAFRSRKISLQEQISSASKTLELLQYAKTVFPRNTSHSSTPTDHQLVSQSNPRLNQIGHPNTSTVQILQSINQSLLLQTQSLQEQCLRTNEVHQMIHQTKPASRFARWISIPLHRFFCLILSHLYKLAEKIGLIRANHQG